MRISKFSASIVAGLIATPLFAAPSWVNGAIDFVLVQDGGTSGDSGVVLVAMQNGSGYLPSCHTGLPNRVFIDLSRAPAKAQLAVLIAADAAGRSVNIDVNETCIQGYALIRNVSMGN